jgi:hypothetical protein
MGKKAKTNRQEQYKAYLEGRIKYREKFVDEKMNLIGKILADESLKKELMDKDRTEMSQLERAAIDTILSRDIQTVEQFEEMKDQLKEDQARSAKFKYQPKEI